MDEAADGQVGESRRRRRFSRPRFKGRKPVQSKPNPLRRLGVNVIIRFFPLLLKSERKQLVLPSFNLARN